MTGPLKILCIIESAGGGAGRHICDLAEALALRGHQIHVIYSPNRSDAVFSARIKDIKDVTFHAVPMQRQISLSDAKTLTEIAKYAGANGPFDLIHGHGSKGGVFAAALKRKLRVPVFYTAHGFATNNIEFSTAARWFFKQIIRQVAKRCEKVICVSRYEQDHARNVLGIVPERLAVIHNGIAGTVPSRAVARKQIGIGENDFCIGCVAMFYGSKGVTVLIPALAEILHHAPQTRFVIAGDGPLKGAVHSKAKTFGIYNKILWLESVRGQDIMPAFDVMALPSLNESFPYVLLEALQAGVPVVASNVGGVKEIIQQDTNGLLVEAGRSDEIATAFRRLLEDPKLLARLRKQAAESSAHFRLSTMVDETLALYRDCLKR